MDKQAVADRVSKKMRKVMKVMEKEYPGDIFEMDLIFLVAAIIDNWDIPDQGVERIMNGAVAARGFWRGKSNG